MDTKRYEEIENAVRAKKIAPKKMATLVKLGLETKEDPGIVYVLAQLAGRDLDTRILARAMAYYHAAERARLAEPTRTARPIAIRAGQSVEDALRDMVAA